MPERDAVVCNLGDGFVLIAAGLKRETSGDLTADLMLQNGTILYQDRGVLNTADGRRTWSLAAGLPDGPTPERMADALLKHVLPDALARLQEEPPKKPTQADQLVGMFSELLKDFATDVADAAELFHDSGGSAFATIPVGDHYETWPLQSRGFRQWMARRFHEKEGKTPNAQALVDATAVLAGKAIFEGPEHQVHLRIAAHEGRVFLDLANEGWEAVAIDRYGWRVVANPPVKFRRTRGMLPLPTPVPGGDVRTLRRFINVPSVDADDDDGAGDDAPWILVVAWLIAAFRPHGPYPLLNLMGGQGSAKSTMSRVLRSLIDPNKAPIRTLPRSERDLMIATSNSWCQAFDNLSHLQDWQSDALCRISTGGGFAVRELYTDQDETILDAQRPLILNGIEEVATRGDLLDRSLTLSLLRIPAESRQTEKQFWAKFEEARPALLGAVLDVVSVALKNESTVDLSSRPRMADFAEWIVAAEPALPWEPGAFLTAYAGNQTDANEMTLDASPVAQAVRDLTQGRTEPWVGTASELLNALEEIIDERTRNQKSWPASGRVLANDLRRLAANLREVEIDVTWPPRQGRRRNIRIERVEKSSSPSSLGHQNASAGGDSGDDETGGGAAQRHPDDTSSSSASPAWHQDALDWRGNPARDDDGDRGDDELPTHSVVSLDHRTERWCLDCGAPLPDGRAGFYCEKHGRESLPRERAEDPGSSSPRPRVRPVPRDAEEGQAQGYRAADPSPGDDLDDLLKELDVPWA
jgi:hypothetical protein